MWMNQAPIVGCVYYFLLIISYCKVNGQQAPAYSTEKWGNATHRTNVCERQRMVLNGTLSIDDALAGLELSTITINYRNFFENQYFTLNSDGVIDSESPGLFGGVMDELAERAGFSWRDSFTAVLPPDPKVDINKTWADLLVWGVDKFDVSVEYWMKSSGRMALGVHFPEGYIDSSIVLVGPKVVKKSVFNPWRLFYPFHYTVWILIGVAILYTGFVYWILEKINHRSNRDTKDAISGSIYSASMAFLGHNELTPDSHSARLVTWSWNFWAMLIGASYIANMANVLVAQQVALNNIQGVEDAIDANLPICVLAGTLTDDILTHDFSNAILIRESSEGGIFESLEKNDCAYAAIPLNVWEINERSSKMNVDCKIERKGAAYKIIQSGIALKVDSGEFCSSLISHVLDIKLTMMKGDGTVDRLWQKHLQNVGDQTCTKEKKNAQGSAEQGDQFSLIDVGSIFVIHFSLTIIAVIGSILERLYLDRRSGISLSERANNSVRFLNTRALDRNASDTGTEGVGFRKNAATFEDSIEVGAPAVPMVEDGVARTRPSLVRY